MHLKRFRVEELKRRLATLDEMRVDLDSQLADLDRFAARNGHRTAEAEISRLALPTLLRSIDLRRNNIQNTRKDLERERAAQEQDLAAACEDLRSFELAEHQRLRRTVDAQTRSAQFRRDGLSMMRHLRKHAAHSRKDSSAQG